MYILEFYQDGMGADIAVFETIEDGRAFLAQVPSYEVEELDGFLYEYIMAGQLSDYMEVVCNQHILPLSKWMFAHDDRVEIFWKELPNLSAPGSGMVDGTTRVDAYCIANEDVKDYIRNRERVFESAKAYLEAKGLQVERSFRGSEDGEAILYHHADSEEWRFLTHLDPSFCSEVNLEQAIDALLGESLREAQNCRRYQLASKSLKN